MLEWAKFNEKLGNLRPHSKSWSRGSGFLVLDGNMDKGAEDKDGGSVISVFDYTAAMDSIASRHTKSEFTHHFDSVTGNGFRHRLKYVKTGGLQSSLKALLAYDTNPKTRKAVDVVLLALYPNWNQAPNPRCNQEIRSAMVAPFKCHPSCKPDTKAAAGAAEESNRNSMRSSLDSKSKSGKLGLLLRKVTHRRILRLTCQFSRLLLTQVWLQWYHG